MTESGGQSELLAFALVGWVFGAAIAPEVLIPPCWFPGGKLCSRLTISWRSWWRDWTSPASWTTRTSSIPQTTATIQVSGRVPSVTRVVGVQRFPADLAGPGAGLQNSSVRRPVHRRSWISLFTGSQAEAEHAFTMLEMSHGESEKMSSSVDKWA